MALDADSGHLYIALRNITRINTDGTGLVELVPEGHARAFSWIAVDPGPIPPIPAISTWGVVVLLLLVLTTGTIAFRNATRSAA